MDKINSKKILLGIIIAILIALSITFISVHLLRDVALSTVNYNPDIRKYVSENKDYLEKVQKDYEKQLDELEKEVGTSENLDAIYITNYMAETQMNKVWNFELKYLLFVVLLMLIVTILGFILKLYNKPKHILIKTLLIYVAFVAVIWLTLNLPGYIFYGIGLVNIIGNMDILIVIITSTIIFMTFIFSTIITRRIEAKKLNSVLKNINKK